MSVIGHQIIAFYTHVCVCHCVSVCVCVGHCGPKEMYTVAEIGVIGVINFSLMIIYI